MKHVTPLCEALKQRGDGEIAQSRGPEAEDPHRAALALSLPTTIAKDLRHLQTKLPAEGTAIEDEEHTIEAASGSEEAPLRKRTLAHRVPPISGWNSPPSKPWAPA